MKICTHRIIRRTQITFNVQPINRSFVGACALAIVSPQRLRITHTHTRGVLELYLMKGCRGAAIQCGVFQLRISANIGLMDFNCSRSW